MSNTQPSPTESTSTQDSMLVQNEGRFVRGFADIFNTTGLIIILVGLSLLLSKYGAMGSAIIAGFLWVGAEYFSRYKRSHLPSLFIAIGFLMYTYSAITGFIGDTSFTAFPFIIIAIIMVAFYWRFRLPFCLFIVALSLIMLNYALTYSFIALPVFLILSALVLLSIAIHYDMRDPLRVTRFSDNAFWLHLLAAPCLTHGIVFSLVANKIPSREDFSLLNLFNNWSSDIPRFTNTDALIVIGIVIILSVFALAINRRVLVVSSFGYAMVAITKLLTTGVGLANLPNVAAVSMLIFGAYIVLLGVAWSPLRLLLLRAIPSHPFLERIFPHVDVETKPQS